MGYEISKASAFNDGPYYYMGDVKLKNGCKKAKFDGVNDLIKMDHSTGVLEVFKGKKGKHGGVTFSAKPALSYDMKTIDEPNNKAAFEKFKASVDWDGDKIADVFAFGTCVSRQHFTFIAQLSSGRAAIANEPYTPDINHDGVKDEAITMMDGGKLAVIGYIHPAHWPYDM